MKAFTNTTYTKEQAVALAKHHREQDSYIRGTYGEATSDGWKGCSVGCMANGKHEDYPALFGIDDRIAYLSDRFFENIKNYKDWTVTLFESIEDGSDTTLAYNKFMHWMLVDGEHGVIKFAKTEKSKSAIASAANLFFRAANGETITKAEWRDANSASDYAAAASAANSYAVYAYAAASAAYAANSYAANSYAANSYAAAAATYAANSYAVYACAVDARKNHYEIMAQKLCYFLGGGK